MDHRSRKTSQWIDTKYILGGALLGLYNYDGAGRITSATTLHLSRRDLRHLIREMDRHDDDHEQDPLPF